MTAVTLPILAGSQPAAPKLTSERWIHQQPRHQSCRSAPRPLVHTDARTHAWPQTDRGNRFNPSFTRQAPRLNPHSARGTAAHHFPRFRALALFGRRPPQRVDRFVIPAAKNLHKRRHCSNEVMSRSASLPLARMGGIGFEFALRLRDRYCPCWASSWSLRFQSCRSSSQARSTTARPSAKCQYASVLISA